MTDKIVFFNDKNNLSILAKFSERIDSLSPDSDFEKERNSHMLIIIRDMKIRAKYWDNLCQFNIKHSGDFFIKDISSITNNQLQKNILDGMYSLFFCFVLELYLSLSNEKFERELELAYKFTLENLKHFDDKSKQKIEDVVKNMPIAIFKEIANSDAIKSIKNLDNILSKAEQLKEKWDKDLTEREKQVNKLKDSLTEYKNGFNFVGLYDGFDELSIEKNKEKDTILYWLKITGGIIVFPILVEFIVIFLYINEISSIQKSLIISILPTISLVAISTYYFRVLLFNYKSVKSQLLQIELRKTLCRFIQDYSDYSSKINKENPDALSKFENIIFSGIVMDQDALPSTFDGFEQIVKIMKSIKISQLK
ncbi:MAG: hypothetical protein QM487_05180 [Candidatus Marithrix sp.]